MQRVRIAPGYSQVILTDGNTYNQGQNVYLTEAQFAVLPADTLAKLVSYGHSGPDPCPSSPIFRPNPGPPGINPQFSHIGIDTDGVTYFSPGSNAVSVFLDTDGVPYYVLNSTEVSNRTDTDGAQYYEVAS